MPMQTPTDAALNNKLQEGLNYLNQGQLQQAAGCAQSVLDARPQSADASFLFGLIYMRANDSAKALNAFSHSITHNPSHGAAWAQIANIQATVGDRDQAQTALKNAIANDDGSPNQAQMVAMVYSALGENEAADPWFQKAIALQPENIHFLFNHAICLMYLGRIDTAVSHLETVLKLAPPYANAHWLLSGMRKATDRTHIEQMQELLSHGRYREGDIAFIQYACGKELEDLEDWPAAFTAFENGAKAQRKITPFDEQAEIDLFAALEQTFTRQWFDKTEDSKSEAAPIFIVGEPRTGTTLVERIFTAHSDVISIGEPLHVVNSLRDLSGENNHALTAKLAKASADIDTAALGAAYMRAVNHTGHMRVLDKRPANYMLLPLILKALPKATIIHIKRHPADACFSSFKQLFSGAYPHSYEQREMARHHVRYARLMDVWRERFAGRFHEIAYEELVVDLEPHARALIEFSGLEWQDACLDFHNQSSAATSASAAQVRQPAHTRSIGRWKKYEPQIQPMLNILRDADLIPH